MVNWFRNVKVVNKMALGFGIITLLLIGVVSISIWQTSKIQDEITDLAEVRTPTVQASLTMLNGVNHSLAALRGWMIIEDERFRKERRIAWDDEIRPAHRKLQDISTRGHGSSSNSRNLETVENYLTELRGYQQEIEDIAHTKENTPAVKILMDEAVPLAEIMAKNITMMIDLEKEQEATPIRKELFGIMADIRGSLGLGLANMRTYILTGNEKFKAEFLRQWDKNTRRFDSLGENVNMLTSEQIEAYNIFRKNRMIFTTLPKKMFDIRESNEWNLANAWLKTKAAPIAFDIKGIVERLVKDQNELISSDINRINLHKKYMDNINLIILAVSIPFAVIVAFFVTRAVTGPVSRLTNIAIQLGKGELSVRSNINTDDEIGLLAQSFDKMANDLDSLSKKQNDQNWLNTNIANITSKSQLTLDLESLASLFITEITPLMQAAYSVVYIKEIEEDEPVFTLYGSYGCKNQENVTLRFRLQEGLIGQCAFEKRPILLTRVPSNHIKVVTALGKSSPINILLQPFLAKNDVVGVIEIASFHEFTHIQEKLLIELSQPVANIINAIQANRTEELLTKTQELLEESQAQSEQLQTQQEELKTTNEELVASEETLKTQQEELKSANEELEESGQNLKTQQEELEESNKTLEDQRADIEMKNIEIEKKAYDLGLSSKYKSEFLANMSHELRTPLNSILLLSRFLIENKDNNLQKDQVEMAENISASGKDLLNLINDILDLAKIESGKVELILEDVLLNSVKAYVEQNFNHQAKDKGLVLKTKLANGLPDYIYTDMRKTEQVLKNLISNALKFTAAGTIVFSVRRPDSNINFVNANLRHNTCIAFVVQDTGPGIPKERQVEIFEAFKQMDGTINRKYGGTGLGLSISNELARLMGGEIHVQSEEGKGSTFTLYLPDKIEKLESSEPETVESVKPQSVFTPSTESNQTVNNEKIQVVQSIPDDRGDIVAGDKTLLIIEDDINFAQILMKLGREKGFKCVATVDGESGLQLVHDCNASAIILDIRLPGINGMIVLDRLKEDPKTRHIPVHMFSVEDNKHTAIKFGAVGFHTKPVSSEEIEESFRRIEHVISGKLKQILVVEDDEIARKAITELLGNGDITISSVSTGGEALKILRSKCFDCMVLDLGLDDMSGFDLLEKIKNDADLATIPVIVYTGKELSKEEEANLRRYTESIVVKGVKSHERLLDEASLFLHRVEANLPKEKQRMIRMVHNTEDIFKDKTVLLVDDDMRNVFALKKFLQNKGLEVVVAANGQESLEALDKDPEIDIVLMDIMMPVMDGYEAMQKIREQDRFKNLSIIALTAKAMKEDRAKCIQAGANDYLPKPVDIDKLTSLLRVWLYK
ncbi:MAG: response regulator [Candidatus Anammoxibacter sp.]